MNRNTSATRAYKGGFGPRYNKRYGPKTSRWVTGLGAHSDVAERVWFAVCIVVLVNAVRTVQPAMCSTESIPGRGSQQRTGTHPQQSGSRN
jgi:hypothetical protein